MLKPKPKVHHPLQHEDVQLAIHGLWELLGLDPDDVRSVGIAPGAITAVVLDQPRTGKRYLSRTEHVWLVL